MGPEALQQYMNPDEAIKRLAAAQGIDYLNLIKSVDERNAEQQQAMQQQQQQMMMSQAGQLAKAPLADPSKNPGILEAIGMGAGQQQAAEAPPDPELTAPLPGAQ